MNIFTDMLRLTSFPSDIRDIRRGEGGGRGERSVRFLHLQSLWLDSICMESFVGIDEFYVPFFPIFAKCTIFYIDT